MDKIREKFKEFPEVFNFMCFVLGGILLIYITNNWLSIFAPFVIAYVVTIALRPAITWLKRKAKIPNVIATILCLLLFVIVVGAIMWLIGYYVVDGIAYLVSELSSKSTINDVLGFVATLDEKLEALSKFINIDINMSDVTKLVTDTATKLVTSLSAISINIVTAIPRVIIAFVIGCVAAFYMLFDYEKISTAVKKQLSDKTKQFVSIFNNQVLFSLFKMMFSYALLSVVCFVELMIGFYIFGIKDAAFLALLIAIFDVLPIVGSGGILVPWGIITLIMGNPFAGIGLIVLWGIIVVVRQVLEPKIVGTQVGLYPLITVAALYIGLRFMGGIGMIVAPLYVLLCKKLNEEGLIHLYKNKETDQKHEVQKKRIGKKREERKDQDVNN
jgi:sporulation integral membrane protein YtvI